MRVESVVLPLLREVIKRPKLSDLLFRFDPWGNPFDLETMADPTRTIDTIRASGPVVWKSLYQQWIVTGYDEAREVLNSPHTGTANQIQVVLDVHPYTKLSEQSRAFTSNLMLLTDPPLHTRLRGLVNRAFTPRRVARLDEQMDQIITDLIDDFDAHEVELVNDFALPFPASVIASLLGLGSDRFEWVRRISTMIVKITEPLLEFDPAEVDAAIDELYEVVLAEIAERRREPREDLLTGLALAQDEEGSTLSDDELVSVAGIIMIAGHETTASIIASSIVHLYRNPDQLAMIRDRPELWPNAVEELLRYDTALAADPRTALEDFELAGHAIRKGQNIVVLNYYANRDLRRWPDGDELRLDRDNPSGLSFGHGIHYCLGANLARAEIKAALPRLLEALGDFTIDPTRLEWRRSSTLRGPRVVPIKRGS